MSSVRSFGERYVVQGDSSYSLSSVSSSDMIYDREDETLYVNPGQDFSMSHLNSLEEASASKIVQSEDSWDEIVEEVWNSEHGSRRRTPLEKPEYDSF